MMAIIGSAFPQYVLSTWYGAPNVARIKAAASSTNATLVKNSAGMVAGIISTNNAASARYLKLYDKATAPVVGTDTPLFTVVLEANAAPSISIPAGIPFANGIAFAITTGVADSDTGQTSADDVHGCIVWS